jgi:hypothetical protein
MISRRRSPWGVLFVCTCTVTVSSLPILIGSWIAFSGINSRWSVENMNRVGWETRKVVRVSPFGMSTRRRKKNTRMRSLVGLSTMAVKRPTVFEDNHGVRLAGHAQTRRLSRRRHGVTSVQDIIGFGHVRTISRRSEDSTQGETLSSDVVSWTGMTCRCVRVSAICVRTMLPWSRSRRADLGHHLTCPSALLLPQEL